MRVISSLMLVGALLASFNAAGDTSTLTLPGDLLIHPNQIVSYFNFENKQIQSTSNWTWPTLQFSSPYKTQWSQVTAQGPYTVNLDSSQLAQNLLTVDLNWASPSLTIGTFEIHDKIVQRSGAFTLTIDLDGTCSNASIKIPSGNWKIHGVIGWIWKDGVPTFGWRTFQLQNAASVPVQVNLGQCTGPEGLQDAIRETVINNANSQAWLESAVKSGVLSWVENSVDGLRAQLMTAQTATMRPGLTFTWQPSSVQIMPSGVLRVPGNLVFRKTMSPAFASTGSYSTSTDTLNAVSESQFLFPRDAINQVTSFLYKTGDLQTRIPSDQVSAFKDLMASSTNQDYVFPDLKKFAQSTLFYFDLSSSVMPSVGSGSNISGGVSYNIVTNLLMNMWAPVSGTYYPYFDFTSKMSGSISATVNSTLKTMSVTVKPTSLPIVHSVRSEFAKLRTVDSYVNDDQFSSSGSDYLTKTPFTVNLPTWDLDAGVYLGARTVTLTSGNLSVPIGLVLPATKKSN